MIRAVCLLLVVTAGCARPAPVEPTSLEKLKVSEPAVIVPTSETTESFESAADLGGRAVERAVAPDTPALAPIERFTVAPRPRTRSASIIDPDTTPKVKHIPTPLLPTGTLTVVRLAPPMERVPPDLGAGAAAVPAKPKLPVAAPQTKRSRDVNLPPPLPTLGRPVGDRVGFEDPTTELGNAVITNPPLKAPLAQAPFLKVGLPDPFELGAQIRHSIPRAVEPGLTPALVNPRRVK
jgi:hypothetical protein